MFSKPSQDKLNSYTQEFLQEKCGVSVSAIDAEEIRLSIIQYCQILLEIAQEQGICITSEKSGEYDSE